LFDGGRPGEPERRQRPDHSGKIDDSIADRAEDPGRDRLPEIPPFFSGLRKDTPVDVFEVHVIDAVGEVIDRRHRVDSGISQVPRIQAHPQAFVVHVREQRLDLVEELHIRARVLVEDRAQAVLTGNGADLPDAFEVSAPRSVIHSSGCS